MRNCYIWSYYRSICRSIDICYFSSRLRFKFLIFSSLSIPLLLRADCFTLKLFNAPMIKKYRIPLISHRTLNLIPLSGLLEACINCFILCCSTLFINVMSSPWFQYNSWVGLGTHRSSATFIEIGVGKRNHRRATNIQIFRNDTCIFYLIFKKWSRSCLITAFLMPEKFRRIYPVCLVRKSRVRFSKYH